MKKKSYNLTAIVALILLSCTAATAGNTTTAIPPGVESDCEYKNRFYKIFVLKDKDMTIKEIDVEGYSLKTCPCKILPNSPASSKTKKVCVVPDTFKYIKNIYVNKNKILVNRYLGATNNTITVEYK